MNAGPMIPSRVAQPLDNMLANTDGFLDIDDAIKKIGGMRSVAEYKPVDRVAERFYQLYQEPVGRELIEWLFELTSRAPMPLIENGFEHAALLAAKTQARQGVGKVIAAAICEGEQIYNRKKEADK